VPQLALNPVCPYDDCPASSPNDIVSIGFSRPILYLKGLKRQRFKCKCCNRAFSDNSLKLSFRLQHHDPAINSRIFSLAILGMSNRKISRVLSISEHSVRIRLHRLAQRALDFHHQLASELPISEPIAFDGLENFAASQYEPNNIQQAIGRDSLFIYDFNFASLNRKGRMSPWQKNKLQLMIRNSGRFNPQNIRIATTDLLRRLLDRPTAGSQKQPLTLLSDEHFQYRRSVLRDLPPKSLEHITVSSKACRNFQNILFAVNHADLLIRQNLASFVRETISFSKTHGRMCQKYALFLVFKNYMSPMFTKTHVRRPNAHEQSPAQQLGLTDKILKFADVFTLRALSKRAKLLNYDWQFFWNAQVPHKYLRSKSFA
jgi:transposase-like protein